MIVKIKKCVEKCDEKNSKALIRRIATKHFD